MTFDLYALYFDLVQTAVTENVAFPIEGMIEASHVRFKLYTLGYQKFLHLFATKKKKNR